MRLLRRVLRPRPEARLEPRLAHQLGRLAECAVTSPDALDRILEGSDDDQRVVVLEDADRRRRDRRAWAVAVPAAAVTVAAALIAAGAGHLAGGKRSPSYRVAVTGSAPPRGGRLSASTRLARPGTTTAAWVAAGKLSILTGRGPTVTVPIPEGEEATNPEWSADGRWLAYLVSDRPAAATVSHLAPPPGGGPTPGGPFQLRVVGADGGGDHQVLAGSGLAAFSWSPAADLIAAVPTAASGRSEGLVVVSPAGGRARRLLPSTTVVNSFVWSPHGRSLAYASRPAAAPKTLPGYLYTVAAAGGRPSRVRWTPPAGSSTILAGWWPSGQGLLAWTDPHGSASLADQGLPLVAVPLRRGKPHVLATTVVYLPWVDWSPDGRLLMVVEGSGASPATGKALGLCQPARGTCRRLSQPGGTASVDPAWSPDGRQVAFVRVKSGLSAQGSFDSRQLWVASADGSRAHAVWGEAGPGQVGTMSGGSGLARAGQGSAGTVAGSVRTARSVAPSAAGSGVVLPAWTADSRSIGYSTADAVVVVDPAAGTLRVVASGLAGGGDGKIGPDVYGKGPWEGAATWDTSPGAAASAG